MTWETAYTLANSLALVAWLPLFFAPRAAVTQRYAATPAAPLVFAVLYTALVPVMVLGDGGGGMESLEALRPGFDRDPVLLLAWTHYLCFDLFVGQWAVRDSARLGLNPWLVAPCLVLIFLLGPLGLLLYLGLRAASGEGLRIDAG